MDILLADKAAEIVGLKKDKYQDGESASTDGASAGKIVWFVISLVCLAFAMMHAYNANRCERQSGKLVMALVLSFLFPKLATIYYAMKYKALPFSPNERLIERYYGARAGEWDMQKCGKWMQQAQMGSHMTASNIPPQPAVQPAVQPSAPPAEGGVNMFGGWQ